MNAPAGIVTARAGTSPVDDLLPTDRMLVDLDPRVHRFLRDHLVGGRPLLSTVMGIETMACAVRRARPDARIESITDVRVGPPYLLPGDGPGSVEVTLSSVTLSSEALSSEALSSEALSSEALSSEALSSVTLSSEGHGSGAVRCEVRSDGPEPHFTADVVLAGSADGPPVRPPGSRRPELAARTVSSAAIYRLYFHGPSFRVIDVAGIDLAGALGRTAVARLARGLPPIVEPARRSIAAPLLIELCLQTAGLWDLAAGNAMTIPRSIERVRRFSDVDSDSATALYAVVEAGVDDGGPRFDATVVDAEGRVHLAVDGYRTTPFGHPYDGRAAARIRDQLGPISPA